MTFPWVWTDILGQALLHFVWQGIAAAAVLRLLLLVVPRSRASLRYVLACMTLGIMAAAPGTTMWTLAGSQLRTSGGSRDMVGSGLEHANAAPAAGAGDLGSSVALPPDRGMLPGWTSWVVLMWMVGVALSSLRLAGGWRRSRLLLRDGAFEAGEHWNRTVDRLAIVLGVRGTLQVLESVRVQVPTVVGVLKPSILLPIGVLAGLSPAQMEAVLAHELAHIRRHDYFVNMLQSAVEALLFYHPAVWWVSNAIRAEREHCCDDIAVAACGDRLLYARALTELEARRPVATGLALAASGGSLLSRVRRLLGGEPPLRVANSGWAVAAGTVIMVAGAGALNWMQQVPRVLADANHTPVIAPAPPPPPPGTIDLSNSREEWMSRFSSNGLTITFRGKGRIEFTDDDTDVKRLDPGGFFEIEQRQGWFSWRATRIAARAGADGTIARSFVIDGKTVAQDEGRRWLKAHLLTLIRQTGLGANARVARILKQSGPEGVLREIGQIQGWAKHVYMRQLFEQGQLDTPTVARALDQAGREIDSDFELRTVLQHAAARFTFDSAVAASYANAARTVESDFEQRHALAPALAQAVLPADAAASLLKAAAAGVDSDFEMAELLIGIPSRPVLAAPAPYFEAVNTIESDFEHRRVLVDLLSLPELEATLLDGALRSSGAHLDSDFELATFLIEYLRRQGLAEAQRRPFFDALRTFQSDFERRRVLTALAARPGLLDADIAGISASVRQMGSDFERAEALLVLVAHQQLSPAARDAVLEATRHIGSDHERGKVLSAMLQRGALVSAAK